MGLDEEGGDFMTEEEQETQGGLIEVQGNEKQKSGVSGLSMILIGTRITH